MDRRELLKMIGLATGAVVIGGEFFLTGCKSSPAVGGATFSPADIAFLDEVGDTILPPTKSPGAKAAQIGQFMTVMVNDCYTKEQQKVFHEGIGKLDEACKASINKSFLDASPEERTEFLKKLDAEAKDYQNNKKDGEQDHYFTMIKQLTLLGYFTSKPGATEALRYVAVPGKYDGNYSYKKGDRAWAT
jgi:hypothetical protein